jgi:hypothetical protein
MTTSTKTNGLNKKFDDILSALSGLDGRLADLESAFNAGKLGFMDSRPGRRVIYAHEKGGSLWHFWDAEAQAHIPIEKHWLRGWLRDVYMYTKESEDYGSTEKVCAVIDTGGPEYIVETGATSTTGRSLVAALDAVDVPDLAEPVAINVSRGGEKENVVFLDMWAGGDLVLTESEHYPPNDDPSVAVRKLGSLRSTLGWSPTDPYSASPFDGAVDRTEADATQSDREGAGDPPASEGSSNGSFTFDPHDAPTPTPDNGSISREDAMLLWNAASKQGGHTEESFQAMLTHEFGVETPTALPPQDWEDAWRKADREVYEAEQETFAPDDSLPF